MHIGLDFGTTNSGAAFFDGQQVRAFALDPHSRDPTVLRSTLYVTREHEAFVGQEAIDVYYEQNIGRPSRLARQWVGEIEMTVGDVGTRKGYPIGPTTYVRDVYTVVDELQLITDDTRGPALELLLTKIVTSKRRPRILGLSAVLGIVGAVDIPFIVLSVQWWRTQHPSLIITQSGGLEPEMVHTLMVALLSFSLVYVYLLLRRMRLERTRDLLEAMKHRLDGEGGY